MSEAFSEVADGAGQPGMPMGQRLRAAREAAKMSLRELARRVHLSPSFISQVELGRAAPSVGTLYAMTSELGLSLDSLMGDGDPKPVAVTELHPETTLRLRKADASKAGGQQVSCVGGGGGVAGTPARRRAARPLPQQACAGSGSLPRTIRTWNSCGSPTHRGPNRVRQTT